MRRKMKSRRRCGEGWQGKDGSGGPVRKDLALPAVRNLWSSYGAASRISAMS